MIRHATLSDTPVIEEILLDVVEWLDANDMHLWEKQNVRWDNLARVFQPEDFILLFVDGEPAACVAIVDDDPYIWPEFEKGESLFLHKLAVKRAFRGRSLVTPLIDYARRMAQERGISAIRLDAASERHKVRAIYERENFVCVGERVFLERFHVALYCCQV